MRIVRLDEYSKKDNVDIMQLPLGTVFTADIGASHIFGGVFLRVFDGIVSLDSPLNTWTNSLTKFIVNNFIEFDAELIIRRKGGD